MNISLSRDNQSQAKFKSTVDGNLLQSWVNLTIAMMYRTEVIDIGKKETKGQEIIQNKVARRSLTLAMESGWVVYGPENGYNFLYPPSFEG